MANNIRNLRVSFLLTPSQLASRLGIEVEHLRRLENNNNDVPEEWAEAIARVLGIPKEVVTDPIADIKATAAAVNLNQVPSYTVCRIGARYAIEAMVAKLGGLRIARTLSEDDLARAVQHLVSYAEDHDSDDQEQRLNRLSQCLQIVVLTILQSRGVDPKPDLPQLMTTARDGALSLLQAFSLADQHRREQEME